MQLVASDDEVMEIENGELNVTVPDDGITVAVTEGGGHAYAAVALIAGDDRGDWPPAFEAAIVYVCVVPRATGSENASPELS